MPPNSKSPVSEFIAQALRMPSLACGSIGYERAEPRRPPRDPDLPLVSIVTVAFNAAASIEAAIRSVAEQNYAGPIEYIVIDGGSTDGTLDLIDRHRTVVDCLVVEPDDGIYDAMNKGLLRARGTYVALLNADDRLYPDFVDRSVRVLRQSGGDISFCDYETETDSVSVTMPNSGLFLSQLGIKHNTFLMHRDCFERLGGFDPRLKVVADAKWNRAAYAAGLRFVHIPEALVFYSTLGLSAGSTEEGRNRIIKESSELILAAFPELDADQARKLYTSNFNTHNARELIDFSRRFSRSASLLSDAIRNATIWNLAYRSGYRLNLDDTRQFKNVLALTEHFDVALDTLRLVETDTAEAQAVQDFLHALNHASTAAAARGGAVHLHFAREFSSPSETFIHDLLVDLSVTYPEDLHVMLCDRRVDPETRSFAHVLTLPWSSLPKTVAQSLYALAWQRLDPDRIVAHFALNGWWLYKRLTPAQRDRPWINMCHGVDVFTIGENPGYTRYIREYCSLSPKVAFTAVSGFLADLLVDNGVPAAKVFTVPNAVSENFARHRKSDDFWTGTRPLEILSTGRLIAWKGHDILLRALAELASRRPGFDFTLTIVYGRMDAELPALETLARELGLDDRVRFLPFVDFRASPDFIAGFDLFVLPSTVSDDPVPRTETFGVAMIEAIASGLPVIGTDAGGIPETVGDPDPAAAIIVPHGEFLPLSDAIEAMIGNADAVFAPHAAYADARGAAFSTAARLEAFSSVDAWFEIPRKRIVHFCALGEGGAFNASSNIHKGLLRRGFDSVFVTRESELERMPTYLPAVVAMKADYSVDFNHLEPSRRTGFTTFTLDDDAISDASLEAVVAGADLINLTWSAKFLSVRNIARLTRLGVPVAVTLRDMQPITGGCHFFHDCDGFTRECSGCPQLPVDAETEYSRLTLAAKKAAWNFEATTFIALSGHSMDILGRSALARDVPRVKLPNFVEVDTFYPDPTPLDPEFEGLSKDAVVIGYLPSFNSRIKGHKELCQALWKLHRAEPDLRIIVLLASNDPLPEADLPFEVRRVGSIKDRNRLRRFYNCADIVAVPSLEETFSNTTLEALACGTPVVGFRTGVLDELLRDGSPLGTSVEIGNTTALAEAISKLARLRPDRAEMADRIGERFGWESRIAAYETVFNTLMEIPPESRPLGEEATAALAVLDHERSKLKKDFSLQRLRNMRNQVHAEKAKLAKSQRELGRLRQEVEEAQDHLKSMYMSRSWRIMAPYRMVGRLILKGIRPNARD